jgi:bifunctional DNA-binding transcriptional regulator/antitoxin component of YhaV-PrlF toxin-antitoxin module
MNPSATLSSKFQISIPKRLREEMHWVAGVVNRGQGY